MITRETVIGDLSKDAERVQYDENDTERLRNAGDAMIAHFTDFFASLDGYIKVLESPVNEDSPREVATARGDLIEKWALAQAALSKGCWILRVDGQEAFARLCASLKTSKPYIVSDL